MKKQIISNSYLQTEDVGKKIAKEYNDYNFIALYGELGVGKTVFVRGFVSHYYKNYIVKSPTFSIVNVYGDDKNPIYHFDMYRIMSDDDLYSTGYYDYLDNGIVISEWSENIPYALPSRYLKITIERVANDEEKRVITIETFGG